MSGAGRDEIHTALLKPGLRSTLFQVDVQPDTTRLEVTAEHDDPASQVGLYIYKAPEAPQFIIGDAKAGLDATAMVFPDFSHAASKRWAVNLPPAGKYVVAIDPLIVPRSGLKVRFGSIVTHPDLGSMICPGSEVTIAPGMSNPRTFHGKAHLGQRKGGRFVAQVVLVPVSGPVQKDGTAESLQTESVFA